MKNFLVRSLAVFLTLTILMHATWPVKGHDGNDSPLTKSGPSTEHSTYSAKAREILQTAKKGDAEAQYQAGRLYQFGREGVIQDDPIAVEWFQQAVAQGHVKAHVNLGYLYLKGRGCEKNLKRSLALTRVAAKAGNRFGQFNLGWHYQYGLGTDQNYREALRWYRKAAAQGHVKANHMVGLFYLRGMDCEVDYELAFKHSLFAANQSHSYSQYNVAEHYSNGWGVPKDTQKAIPWYLKAAGQGHVKSHFRLGSLYLTGDGCDRDYRQALHHTTMAAQKDHPEAFYNLGLIYWNGWGVPRDVVTAFEWFEKAGKEGEVHAHGMLAYMRFKGIGCEQNKQLAAAHGKLAAEADLPISCWNYGLQLWFGEGVTRNREQGETLMLKAERLGYRPERYPLGYWSTRVNSKKTIRFPEQEYHPFYDPAYAPGFIEKNYPKSWNDPLRK